MLWLLTRQGCVKPWYACTDQWSVRKIRVRLFVLQIKYLRNCPHDSTGFVNIWPYCSVFGITTVIDLSFLCNIKCHHLFGILVESGKGLKLDPAAAHKQRSC